jgi:hypothetical protein
VDRAFVWRQPLTSEAGLQVALFWGREISGKIKLLNFSTIHDSFFEAGAISALPSFWGPWSRHGPISQFYQKI